jgi:glycine/D-amino acid oxidase-like deaminating enzyme
MVHVVETDVLVVGGGGAAARAALEAVRAGVRVTMIMKGRFGAGGATGTVNLLAKTFSVDPESGVRQIAIDIVRNGFYHFGNLGKSAFEWLNMYHHRSDRHARLFGSERQI